MPHVARSIRACVRARWQSQFGTEKYSNFIHKNLVLFQSSKYIYIYIFGLVLLIIIHEAVAVLMTESISFTVR
jgi:hypothetical protein